ncbi:MAG: hypothetical protein JO337_14110, partial [Acidimicrobiales bacterium]|nr:hypothetical protein [Acidimicrobiales bacterium]
DVGLRSFDRDLVDACIACATPVIAVRSGGGPTFSASDLGVSAELAGEFRPDDLTEVLAVHCRPVGRGDRLPPALDESSSPRWLAPMYAVCGPGGTGASTVAIALAQGLGHDARYGRRVLLADLARRADQAMFHDAIDLGPGLQELVEAHRVQRPGPEDVAGMTFDVPRRGYRLLLGLRQPELWAALRPRAVDAAVTGLRRTFQLVVADVTGDVEGEAEGGSPDVEERNHLARAATRNATVTVVVGAPGMKGVHSLASLIRALVRAGVSADRLVAVINRGPRHPGARAEAARALAELLSGTGIELPLSGPVHSPERKLEETLREGTALPLAMVDPLVRAVEAVAERVADAEPAHVAAVRIAPGSLGSWSADVETGPS